MHAEEVEQVFDAISYFKGSTVVRMLHAILGDEHFKSGLRAYFKKHAYVARLRCLGQLSLSVSLSLSLKRSVRTLEISFASCCSHAFSLILVSLYLFSLSPDTGTRRRTTSGVRGKRLPANPSGR